MKNTRKKNKKLYKKRNKKTRRNVKTCKNRKTRRNKKGGAPKAKNPYGPVRISGRKTVKVTPYTNCQPEKKTQEILKYEMEWQNRRNGYGVLPLYK